MPFVRTLCSPIGMRTNVLRAGIVSLALLFAACSGGSEAGGPPVGLVEGPDDSTTTTAAVETTTTTGSTGAGVAVTRVIDGDTLTLADGRTVRLAQVDAPETSQCFGSESTAALQSLADGKTVELRRAPEGPETDRYGRTLADVIVDGVSVNEVLVREGAAEWYEQFASEDLGLARRLQAVEREASAAGRGLWAACRAPSGSPPPTPGGGDVHYPNCSEARRAGAAPILRGEPGYRSGLDGDNDGIACE